MANNDCALCGRENMQVITAVVNGKPGFICGKHGATTQAMTDVIKGSRRFRIFSNGKDETFTLYLYNEEPQLAPFYFKSNRARKGTAGTYKRYATAHRKGVEFVTAQQ